MEGWRTCKLGEFVNLQRGYDLPQRLRRPGPVPIVSSSGVTGYHDEPKVRGPGVVTGRYGTLGEVFYVREDFWPLNTALFVNDFKNNDPLFASYLLRSLKLNVQSAAGAVPGVNRNHLHMLEIRVPSLPAQRRIGDILSSYDDLIENNIRRIKILEEMARSLYREWFVHFRFPGHQHLALINSSFGKHPAPWKLTSLGECSLNFDSRRKPLSSMQRAEMKGMYPYYGAAKVIDLVNDYIFDGRYLLVAEDGSVITDDRRPVLQIATGRFWVNNHTHIIQGRTPVSTDFLYLHLNEVDITPYITGAAQPKITQANLNRIPLLLPDPQLLRRFDTVVGPMLATIDVHRARNELLRCQRDLLLPRLISGEIDVSSLPLPPAA